MITHIQLFFVQNSPANPSFFLYSQMGAQIMIEEPYELRAGDSFKTTCMYNNQDEERVFGKNSDDEMCLHLVTYYPRRHLGSSPFICGPGMHFGDPQECEGTYTRVQENEVIQNSLDFVRPFGVPASVCHVMEEEPQEQEEQVVDKPPNATAAVPPKTTTTTTQTKATTTPDVPKNVPSTTTAATVPIA
jgi:Copper type II ascorbate-dependent monooxygenase, C-terminal domain